MQQSREVVLLNMLGVKLSDLLLRQQDLSLESHSEACFLYLGQDLLCISKQKSKIAIRFESVVFLFSCQKNSISPPDIFRFL